jgi:Chaperone of endosialidase
VYAQSIGNGIWGDSTGNDGIYGQSSASSYAGIHGQSIVAGIGVKGESAGGYGGYFTSTGAGLYGLASGNADGIHGVTDSTLGNSGVSGACSGTVCNGVYGSTNSTATTSAGVYGYNSSSGTGVYGASSTGYGGYFPGKLYGGVISCGSGCTSDIRLKKKVKPLRGALAELLSLKGVTFEWNDPAEHENHTGTQEGVIAQDVEKVRPQWVHETPDTHAKTVDPDARTMVALTVEAFREMQTQLDAERARADKAEAKLADHDARLDAIERGHPRAPMSPIGFNPVTGVGAFGILVGGIAFLSARRRKEDKAS